MKYQHLNESQSYEIKAYQNKINLRPRLTLNFEEPKKLFFNL